MIIKNWPIERVKPYDKNPRINDGAVDAVAASLKEFGWRQPIVVDAAGVIIVGHTRWKAAKKLGLAKVPVHVATDMSEAQVKAYRLADNQTATLAEWDYELLPIEIADLQGMDFDLPVLGFSDEALAGIMGTASDVLTDSADVAIVESYQVSAECKTEAEQKKLYDRLTKEGYQCRLLML